jgi:hypothetical protein
LYNTSAGAIIEKLSKKAATNNLSADNTHHGVWKCALKRFETRDVNNSTDVRNDISLIEVILLNDLL